MYGVLASGYANWPIVKQLAWLMGKIMNGIYNILESIGIQNIGICIIVFTIVVYTLMIPLTIKQQKWSKLSAVMSPEMQKIQKKYANKKDQASMMKQQEELNILYEKYGTSPTGGCLPMLIQMPLLFSFYPVIQNIPKYVDGVKEVYMPVVNQIMATNGYQKIMETIGSASPVHLSPDKFDYTQADTLVNVLYRFQDATWGTLVEKIPSLEGIVSETTATMGHLNSFLGINIGETPFNLLMASFATFSIAGIVMAVIIPVLAGLTQFISVKLQPTQQADPDNAMANQMKTMTYTMPLFSVFLGFTLPAGLGLYWAVSAAVRCIQQLGINKYLNNKGVDKLIEENQKKAAAKREKKGTSAKEINKMATTNTRNVETAKKKSVMTEAERQKKLEEAAKYSKNAKAGSLTSKANLVSRYNSGQNTEEK